MKKYIKNISWLLLEKLGQIISGLFIGVWIARYLGVDDFGTFSYAQSFVVVFSVIAKCGFDSIVVKKLVEQECVRRKNEIVWSVFTFQIVSSVCSVLFISQLIPFFTESIETIHITLILSISIVFQSIFVIDWFFQSMVQSKYIAKAKFLVMLISSVIKVWLIISQYSLAYFAYTVVAESIIILVLYLYYYSSLGFYRKHWKFRLDIVKSIFLDSWPIMLTTLSAILYTRIDQFMIHSMLSNSELGIYSAAIRLTESWLFIPMIIQSTFFPLIISAKEEGVEIYNRRLLILTGLTGAFSVLVGVIVSLGSDYIMVLLYGDAYSLGGSVLSIKIWESVLASVATVSSVWAIIENLQRALVKILLLGLVTNAILNYFMIPYLGGDGAAYASLISGFATLAVFPVFDKRFRYIVALRIRTLLFINALDIHRAIVIEIEDRKKAV